MEISDLFNNENINKNNLAYRIFINKDEDIIHIHLADGIAIEIYGKNIVKVINKRGPEYYINKILKSYLI